MHASTMGLAVLSRQAPFGEGSLLNPQLAGLNVKPNKHSIRIGWINERPADCRCRCTRWCQRAAAACPGQRWRVDSEGGWSWGRRPRVRVWPSSDSTLTCAIHHGNRGPRINVQLSTGAWPHQISKRPATSAGEQPLTAPLSPLWAPAPGCAEPQVPKETHVHSRLLIQPLEKPLHCTLADSLLPRGQESQARWSLRRGKRALP